MFNVYFWLFSYFIVSCSLTSPLWQSCIQVMWLHFIIRHTKQYASVKCHHTSSSDEFHFMRPKCMQSLPYKSTSVHLFDLFLTCRRPICVVNEFYCLLFHIINSMVSLNRRIIGVFNLKKHFFYLFICYSLSVFRCFWQMWRRY